MSTTKDTLDGHHGAAASNTAEGKHDPSATGKKSLGEVFDKNRAKTHDQQLSKVAAINDALFLAIRMALLGLPEDAHILAVGAGTGTEVITLSQTNPAWKFTIVEPAKPMMDVCRTRMAENGLTERCTFHEGYLSCLPSSDVVFDAATSLCVSMFCTTPETRTDYYRQILQRLKPGGLLLNSDLSADVSSAQFPGILQAWLTTLEFAGDTPEVLEKRKGAFFSK